MISPPSVSSWNSW